MVFTHSASGGKLQGNRLTLRGVGRRVTWVDDRGRSGTVSARMLHRMVFARPATGALHVAGHRGGDEPTFRLSRPRYDPARRTVSYRVKPLNKKPLPSHAARAAGIARARKFGAASLTIVPAPLNNPSCTTAVLNQTGHNLTLVSASTGEGMEWDGQPPASIPAGGDGGWSTYSPSGCWNTVVYEMNAADPLPTSVQFTFDQNAAASSGSNTCTSSDPAFQCNPVELEPGVAEWTLAPA
jgi:hypothetical protein